MKLEFSRQFCGGKKVSNIKSYENPSVGSRVVPCGQTDHRTDVTKLIIAFRSFADAPKNGNQQLGVGLGVKVSYQQTREGCLVMACHVFCHVVLNMR